METADLKRVRLKVTIPRKKILEILERVDSKHVSAEDIYKKLLDEDEEISLATVYRVLAQFETAGLVIRHSFNNRAAVFELIQDGGHHDHIVCVRCGKILEFHDTIVFDQMEKIASSYKVAIVEYTLTMYVRCEKCKSLRLA